MPTRSIVSKRPIQIFFRNLPEPNPTVLDEHFIISPINGKWNNFKYHVRAKLLYFRPAHPAPISFSISIQFAEPDGISDLKIPSDTASEDEYAIIEISEFPKDFISLLERVSDYFRLTKELGVQRARRLLHDLHDASILAHLYPRSKSARILGNQAIGIDILRGNDAYFAYRNGYKHVLGINRREELTRRMPSFSLSFRLKGFRLPHSLCFTFEPGKIASGRISVLIGRNGVGKSQSLLKIIEVLKKGPEDKVLRNEIVPSTKTSTLLHADYPEINKILVFSSASDDPFPRRPQGFEGLEYQYVNLIPDRTVEARYTKSVVDIISSDLPILNTTRTRLLSKFLFSVLKIKNLYLPLSARGVHLPSTEIDKKHYIDLRTFSSLNEHSRQAAFSFIDTSRPIKLLDNDGSVLRLSSGQKVFLSLLLNILAFLENGSLVLLEEPENHLHPNYISEFVSLLDDLLESTNSCAIVATHSVYVVREVERESVQVIEVDEKNNVYVDKPMLQTFAGSTDKISTYVFGDPTVEKLHERLFREKFQGEKSIQKIIDEYADVLSSEALIYIRNEVMKNGEATKAIKSKKRRPD